MYDCVEELLESPKINICILMPIYRSEYIDSIHPPLQLSISLIFMSIFAQYG